jgi:hypothetical protein
LKEFTHEKLQEEQLNEKEQLNNMNENLIFKDNINSIIEVKNNCINSVNSIVEFKNISFDLNSIGNLIVDDFSQKIDEIFNEKRFEDVTPKKNDETPKKRKVRPNLKKRVKKNIESIEENNESIEENIQKKKKK